MQKIKQQIENFWQGKTSKKENGDILRTLEESPAEWKSFLQRAYEEVLEGKEYSGWEAEQKQKILDRLKVEINNLGQDTYNDRGKVRTMVWWATAACAVLMAGWGIYRFIGNAPQKEYAVDRQASTIHIVSEKNTGAADTKIALPDGSVVMLAPGSTIHYNQPMGSHARDIHLEGRAGFDVAKDTARPFTVWAKGFTTTALGTKFIVDAGWEKRISIRLLRGKVVVKATAGAGMQMPDVYLIPGQAFLANMGTGKFWVRKNNVPGENTKLNTALEKKKPAIDILDTKVNSSITFDKTPLSEVFYTIGKNYKTKIIFEPAEVQDLLFTGTFTSNDPLHLALSSVCTMNGLSFGEKRNIIFITKQK